MSPNFDSLRINAKRYPDGRLPAALPQKAHSHASIDGQNGGEEDQVGKKPLNACRWATRCDGTVGEARDHR